MHNTFYYVTYSPIIYVMVMTLRDKHVNFMVMRIHYYVNFIVVIMLLRWLFFVHTAPTCIVHNYGGFLVVSVWTTSECLTIMRFVFSCVCLVTVVRVQCLLRILFRHSKLFDVSFCLNSLIDCKIVIIACYPQFWDQMHLYILVLTRHIEKRCTY